MSKALRAMVTALMICTAAAATTTTTTKASQKPPKADDVLQQAQGKAVDQNKSIFLIFGASWCEACHQLDRFLAAPEVMTIFDKYFIIAKVSFGEAAAGHPDLDNPGSDDLITKYGGLPPGGGQVALPFIAVVDPKGKLIVNSKVPGQNHAKGADADFATDPEETRLFLSMLKKGAPALTDDETRKIQEALRQAATNNGTATQ